MYWGPDSREPHYTRSERCTSIPVPPERLSWLKLLLPCFRLAFGCVCMMKSWIVVNWGKMIQPWKPSPEVVGRPWGNFWARTHLIWRGIHRQNEFFSSCLDVFENSNFCFFSETVSFQVQSKSENVSPGDPGQFLSHLEVCIFEDFLTENCYLLSKKSVWKFLAPGMELSVHTQGLLEFVLGL